jgi:hypothetical protein
MGKWMVALTVVVVYEVTFTAAFYMYEYLQDTGLIIHIYSFYVHCGI